MEEYINGYIRPRLQGDGGEITFVKQEGDEVTTPFSALRNIVQVNKEV